MSEPIGRPSVPRTLPQCDPCQGPARYCCPVGCLGHLEIVNARDVLENALPVSSQMSNKRTICDNGHIAQGVNVRWFGHLKGGSHENACSSCGRCDDLPHVCWNCFGWGVRAVRWSDAAVHIPNSNRDPDRHSASSTVRRCAAVLAGSPSLVPGSLIGAGVSVTLRHNKELDYDAC